MLRVLARFGLGSLSLLLLLSVGLLSANFWTYSRLTAETDIASLSITQIGDRSFLVDIATPDGRHHRLPVQGDEWQLDARVIKWTGWAQLAGRSPLYRLERLSGRYLDVASELERPRTVHGLGDNPGLDIWSLAREHSRWIPGVDAAYGSSTYLPLADGARYRVYLSQTGLLARPLNALADGAVVQWN